MTHVADPEVLLGELKKRKVSADIFTFMQRLPASKPEFDYHMEWDNVAAIPIHDYEHWLSKQLHQNSRNKLRKGMKKGLTIKTVDFDDALIRDIKEIQDEVPVRQGRPYAYYGKDLEWVRTGYSTYLDRAVFIGAFFRDELVGFLKLVSVGRFARTMGLLTRVRHRDLAPMNALIAKAVEICAERRFSHLVYGRYDYGKVGSDSVVDFKFYNGFEHILLPRYFIPLNAFGRLALGLRIQRGIKECLPRSLVQTLRRLKVGYYERKYREEIESATAGGGSRVTGQAIAG